MKKLMVAAAAVMFGIAAHAAAYTWNGMISVYDWDSEPGGPATGAIEFFVNGTSVGSFDFDDGDATFSFGINSGNSAEGIAGDTIKAICTVANFSDGTGTREWSFLFDEAYIATTPGAGEAMSLMTQAASAEFNNNTGLDFSKTIAQNGYTAVPEPTSGLLLLLGMAGLALRRRRA